MPSSGGPGGQWNVAALLARRPASATKNKRSRGARFESRFEYLVQWEDRDPTTGERYEPSWEPTTYITPAAIESYYIDKYEGADAQRQDDDDVAHAAPTAAAGAGDVSAAAPDPAPRKEIVTAAAAAAAVPAKADNEAVPRRAKNTRADEATPKRQKSTRSANSGTKDKEKQGTDGATVAAAAATVPAPRKRGTSPTPDKENTKRIRVADMLLT